jgi:hypothetical protein
MNKLHIQNIGGIIYDNGFDIGKTLFRKSEIGSYDKRITINKEKQDFVN